MNPLNNYHHISDEFFSHTLHYDAPRVHYRRSTPQVLAVVWFLRMQATMVHSNTAFSFWIFKYVWVERLYHRIHHSSEPRHWDAISPRHSRSGIGYLGPRTMPSSVKFSGPAFQIRMSPFNQAVSLSAKAKCHGDGRCRCPTRRCSQRNLTADERA